MNGHSGGAAHRHCNLSASVHGRNGGMFSASPHGVDANAPEENMSQVPTKTQNTAGNVMHMGMPQEIFPGPHHMQHPPPGYPLPPPIDHSMASNNFQKYCGVHPYAYHMAQPPSLYHYNEQGPHFPGYTDSPPPHMWPFGKWYPVYQSS